MTLKTKTPIKWVATWVIATAEWRNGKYVKVREDRFDTREEMETKLLQLKVNQRINAKD